MHFQDIIFRLQKFWSTQGCVILQPYDMELGAGTSHPATSLQCLGRSVWNAAYVQPCRRPTDGRYGENPNRLQHYYQFQVIMKPSPENIQMLCIQSLEDIGISKLNNDIRFVEDDWENPTLGAWGLGWEVWCNGMEVMQYTYMQQLGGVECRPVACEITYGLERLAMYIQGVDSVWDIVWNERGITYRDVFLDTEVQYCKYNFELADVERLLRQFADYRCEVYTLLQNGVVQPAYDLCLKMSHTFNLLEARGVLSVTERVTYIKEIRAAVKKCCDVLVAGVESAAAASVQNI